MSSTYIHDQVAQICTRLGLLTPSLVSKLTITPTEAVATVYRTRGGAKYVDEDGNVATDTLTFTVQA